MTEFPRALGDMPGKSSESNEASGRGIEQALKLQLEKPMIEFASLALNAVLIAGIGLWAWNHKQKAKKAALAAVQPVQAKIDAAKQ